MGECIYHLVHTADLRTGIADGRYTPARFAEDRFVHCTAAPEAVLAVARDYFADAAESLLVLRIAPERLSARVAYEAAAPIPGGRSHLAAGETFPHVYGPLELDAITGVAALEKRGADFVWPRRFVPLATVLA